MFVTVHLGEGQSAVFNTNCRIINFLQCLKERCRLGADDKVDLLDTVGELVTLSEWETSTELASGLLKERHFYVPIRVTKSQSGGGQRYQSLLCGLENSHPMLADLLRQLSNPNRDRDRWSSHPKRTGTHREGPNTNRTKPLSSLRKSSAAPPTKS